MFEKLTNIYVKYRLLLDDHRNYGRSAEGVGTSFSWVSERVEQHQIETKLDEFKSPSHAFGRSSFFM